MKTRRDFIANSALLTLGGLTLQSFGTSSFGIFKSPIAPSDQINIGAIGINGMGWADTNALLKNPGVNLVAICDADQNVLDSKMKDLADRKIDASKVATYKDYRALLERKDIDAVVVATPDHWHALMMIEAMEAGKHVYVEKPVGNSITECQTMIAAQKRYNKVVQCGQWQRSAGHFNDALDFIKTGQLGNIRTVKVWAYQGWMKPGPVVPDSAPPPGLDYAMWLGPAKTRPFNSSRLHFNFRWFWDYAGGLMTDWGVHLMDYALLGMGMPEPKSVSALGGCFAYPELYQETPDTLGALYEFDKFSIQWEQAMGIDNGFMRKTHGIAFIGNNGTLELDRGGWEVFEEPGSKAKVNVERKSRSEDALYLHTKNFAEAIRANKPEMVACPIQAGAHIATICQLGNISYRSGKKVFWDAAKKRLTDAKLNKKYLSASYNNGYKLPNI